jgi:hypothetical protein
MVLFIGWLIIMTLRGMLIIDTAEDEDQDVVAHLA